MAIGAWLAGATGVVQAAPPVDLARQLDTLITSNAWAAAAALVNEKEQEGFVNDPTFQILASRVDLAAQRPLAAQSRLEAASRLWPEDAQLHHALGGVRWTVGSYAEATSDLARALTLDPKNPAYRFALIDALLATQRYEEARSALAETEADPVYASAQHRFMRGDRWWRVGYPERSTALLQPLLAELPERQDIADCLIQVHLAQGDVDAADRLLGTEQKDESEIRRLARARIDALRGDIPAAVERMTTIVQSAPKISYQPRVQLAEWQLALGETDLVTRYAEKLTDHPAPEARWNGWLLKGRALWLKGYLSDAATALDQAIALAPQRSHSRLLRARLAFAQRDVNSLNTHIQALEESAPHTPALGVLKGYAAGMKGDIDAALAAWKDQAEAFPNDFEGLYTAGVFLQEQGRLSDAVACLEEAHKRAPGHLGIANNLAMALSETDPKRAAALIKPFATQQSHPYLWDSYGWALYHCGDLDEAEKWILKARAALPQNAEIRWHAAAVAHALKDIPSALEWLRPLAQTNWKFPDGEKAKKLFDTLTTP